jgi:hypothetical protein
MPARRGTAALVALATFASIGFILIHPASRGPGSRAILEGIAAFAAQDRLVHAAEMACVLAFGIGAVALARRLDASRSTVQAALVATLSGLALMLVATLFDGFVTPDVAIAFLRPGHDVEVGRALAGFAGIVVQDAALVAWVMQALGTLGFAAALANGDRGERIAATVAAVCSVVPLAVLGAAYPVMDTGVILSVLGGQLAWNLATVWLLLRAPTTTTRPAAERPGNVTTRSRGQVGLA